MWYYRRYAELAFEANGSSVSFAVELAWPAAAAPPEAGFPVLLTQVRKTPSWPRIWANLSPF
jgi:hypothetical protein